MSQAGDPAAVPHAALTALAQLRTRFAALPDPRVERTKDHQLLDVLTIAICAVLCGANSWVEIETFGHAKRPFFDRFLLLPHGIPSHDTLGRVFARLDPAAFQSCFRTWVQDLLATAGPALAGVVAFDGKTLCGSGAAGKGAIHMVSAWAENARLVLGQVKVDEKSNEITAIPALLAVLDLSGCIVTIDAMGGQTEIARTIQARGADYVLALKGNQPTLLADVQTLVAEGAASGWRDIRQQELKRVEKGHGRLERRHYRLVDDPAYIAYLNPSGAWGRLRSVGIVVAERQVGECAARKRAITYVVLSGWRSWSGQSRALGIENRLHWVLDLAFRKDGSRVRAEEGAANFALLRHQLQVKGSAAGCQVGEPS